MQYTLLRCPQGRWEIARARPGPDVAPWVIDYSGYEELAGWMLRDREVATAIVPFIVNFGANFHIALGRAPTAGARFDSFTAGLYDGYADVAATGRSRCMQANFTPPGAYRFFGLSLRELAGRVIPLEDILGAEARLLAERLHDTPGWGARFDLLDGFIRDRMARSAGTGPEVLWAWQRLVASGGTAPVSSLSSELGWSRKHLAARFSVEIGETPKTTARILRFVRVRREIAGAGNHPEWARLAADCGFADQAHLIREFQAMAGVTPVQYAAGLGGNADLPPADPR